MQDTTLLDRSKPITMDGLRAFFREHDFSAQTSGYKFERASSEKNQIYIKTKPPCKKNTKTNNKVSGSCPCDSCLNSSKMEESL